MVQSAQNMMLSPAAADLGLGDELRQSMDDKLDEVKKKRQRDAMAAAMSPATLSLFGRVGGFGGV